MEAIICNFADNNKLSSGVGCPSSATVVQDLISLQLSNIIPSLLSRVSHPLMQKSLIRALPSRSPLTSYLRRYLALSFLVYPTLIDVTLADPTIPGLIHRHLDKSQIFKTSKATDYSSLAAHVELLDIAIGPGFLTVPYQPIVSPTSSEAGSSPISAPVSTSSEIKTFNKEVDAITQHIKYLGNSIVEAGAVTDLTILDAKDCVERLCARLEHSVRIGGKKIHDPFGDDGDEEKQPKMSKFLSKKSKISNPAPSQGIFDNGEELSLAGP